MQDLNQQITTRAIAVLDKGRRALGRNRRLISCFDAPYYLSQLALVGITVSEISPFESYRKDAAARVVSPNPLFDEVYYLARYTDVAAAVHSGRILSGFDHFVHDGINEGRFPNPDFETEISNNVPTGFVIHADQFDDEFYLDEYDLARRFLAKLPIISAFQFFNLFGRRMGHVPCLALKRSSGASRLEHHPLLKQRGTEIIDLIQPHFDPDYYEEAHGDEIGSMPAFVHYIGVGQREGKCPNRWFDESFYRAFYPDIRREIEAGKLSSGFEHYLRTGRREGRLPAFDLSACLERVFPGITRPIALESIDALERKVMPHPYRVVDDREETVWFLIPRINPDIFFGGYSSVVHLIEAFLLSGRRVGLFLFEDARDAFNYFCYRRPQSLLARRRSEVRLFSALDKDLFRFGPQDIFIAYSAWQALWADEYAKHTLKGSFAFLVQEYEPVFHGHDSMRVIVDMAYKLRHVAIFNSVLLERFFRDQRLGIFERDPDSDRFVTFEHVLANVSCPDRSTLRKRKIRRLLLYARPEAHAARNLLEICLIALRRAVAANVFRRRYEFVGIGALSGPQYVDLGQGNSLEIVPKVDPSEYPKLLQDTDVGLSLMYAPHPSLIPFEMVNAGAIAVTNVFANRDAATLKARSGRLVPVDLTIDGVVEGLRRAVRLAEDMELRTNPAHSVATATSWDQVFDALFVDGLLKKLSSNRQPSVLRLP